MLTTDPMPETPVVLKERRPFSLLLTCVKRDNKTRVDLTGSTLRLVIADLKRKGGDVKVTTTATMVDPTLGVARFDVQADELNFGTGTYLLAVTLISAEGFESSIIEGPVELSHNPDPTIPADHGTVVPPLSLTALFRDQNRVTVRVNHAPDSVLIDLLNQAQESANAAAVAQAAADAAAAAAAAQVAAAQAAAAAAAAQAAAVNTDIEGLDELVAQAEAARDLANGYRETAYFHAQEASGHASAANTAASTALSARDAAQVYASDSQFHAGTSLQHAMSAQTYSDLSYTHAQSSYGYAQDAMNTLAACIQSGDIDDAVVLTQAAYDALGSYNARRLYVIVG